MQEKPVFRFIGHTGMKMQRIVLATFNTDKVREIQDILTPHGFELLSLCSFPYAEEVIEDGVTLMENAFKKAHASYRCTRLPSMADDTGLEVDFLQGAPGVRSSRFAGGNASYRENNEKLLRLMEDVPWEKRSARFRTIVAYVDGVKDRWTEGVCTGLIHTEGRGQHGFGYDPIFYVPEMKKTFAEMTAGEKNALSHRGKAFRKMAEILGNVKSGKV